MLKSRKSVVLLIYCLVLIPISSWALDFNPGKYKITSKVDMPGMPVGIPPQTVTQCMTEQDPVPNANPENQNCKITDLKQTKSKVSWKMECLQQGQKITSSGQITYKGDTFKGNIQTNLGASRGNMTMTAVITGKRISDCD